MTFFPTTRTWTPIWMTVTHWLGSLEQLPISMIKRIQRIASKSKLSATLTITGEITRLLHFNQRMRNSFWEDSLNLFKTSFLKSSYSTTSLSFSRRNILEYQRRPLWNNSPLRYSWPGKTRTIDHLWLKFFLCYNQDMSVGELNSLGQSRKFRRYFLLLKVQLKLALKSTEHQSMCFVWVLEEL